LFEDQLRESSKHEKPVLKCSGGSYGALKAAEFNGWIDGRKIDRVKEVQIR